MRRPSLQEATNVQADNSSARAQPEQATTRAEFASNWPVLLGATLASGLGYFAIAQPAIAVFMRALQSDFGWSRAQISLGPTILLVTLAVASPVLGPLADRLPAWKIAVPSFAFFAAVLFLFSRLGPTLWLYYLGFAALGSMGWGASAPPYARAVSAKFVKGRGLALGLFASGSGVSQMIVPIVLAPFAATYGWRAGAAGLAAVVALGVPLIGALIAPTDAGPARRRPAGDVASERAVVAVFQSPTSWIMGIAFALIPLAGVGLQVHLVALLGDQGVAPAVAGLITGSTGLAVLIGRIGTGWLIDRVFAPKVAAVVFAISAICMATMAILGAKVAVLGAVAFGLSIGAEIDLVGYLVARYYQLGAFGRVFGIFYAITLAGGAFSPTVYGLIFDHWRSYQPALLGSAALLFIAAGLFLLLPPFPGSEDADQAKGGRADGTEAYSG